MCDALLGGFLSKRAFLRSNIVVSDILQNRLDYMQNKFDVQVTLSNVDLLDELRIIFLAVKPQVMDEVLQEIAPIVNEKHLIVSIAAGYSLE